MGKKQFHSSSYRKLVESLPEKLLPNHGYHTQCYSDFTAIVSNPTSEPKQKKFLRSASCSNITSTSGILKRVCLFCDRFQKSKSNTKEPLSNLMTMEAEISIKNDVKILKDDVILAKVSGIDLCAKEVSYHRSCCKEYHSSANRIRSRTETDKTEKNEVDEENSAWYIICSYVDKSVIHDKRIELLPSIYERYILLCDEETPICTAQYLKQKLQTKFGDSLKFHSPLSKKTGVIVSNSTLTYTALSVVYDYQISPEYILQKAAMIMRKELKKVTKIDMFSGQFFVKNLTKLDDLAPHIITDFFRTLYGGPNPNQTDAVNRRAKSASEDALFIVSRGQVKPLKHIAMGISLKSMTGSKKIVTVMNRLGHSLNYTGVQEIETEMAVSLINKKNACPDGAAQNSTMGLAFDNYDELTTTLSGHNTLHDTNGIMYQNIKPVPGPTSKKRCLPPVYADDECTSKAAKIQKRSLDSTYATLDPYLKVPKMTHFDYDQRNVWTLPDVASDHRLKDSIWMTCHAVLEQNIPMWVGFNAQFYKDNLPKQQVLYMPNLNKPITNMGVVQETLRITQKCARECGQEYGIVTYDLAVAKPAVQIQITEKPEFDDVFIMYGPFHIQMCFFKAIGKLIGDAGGLEIMTECGVLATGSMNGVVSGRHFNRCKRLFPMLSLAFESIHFRKFLSLYEDADDFRSIILPLLQDTQKINFDEIVKHSVFTKTMDAYDKFKIDTQNGDLGPTAQFWFMFVNYINHYHLFDRSIRTNDIALFVWCLSSIIDLFFATNHVNYARWLTKYQLDLLNIDKTHPGLRKILEEGAFTIRRTDNSFARMPIDMTLEQTVNRDSASRMTGISCMTNNYASRLRFMITKSSRAIMTNVLMDMTGMKDKNDITTELKPSRLERDNKDLSHRNYL